MRGSGDMILTMALFVILNKLCRSCSTGETRFADVASRTVLSSVVFEGKMLHRVEVSNPSKLSAVKFQVTRLLKGDLPKDSSESVVVGTRIADGQLDCLENLRPKRRYIVFLSSTIEMVGDEVAAYKVSGPPEEYSGRAAKDVEAHSCRNCVQKASVRLSPRKLSPLKTGANVSIKCVAKGRPFPMISWYKNDQPLLLLLSSMNSEHLVIKSKKTNSVLLIRNLTSEDEAVYWCQAENVLTTANSSTVSLVLRKGVEIGTGPPDDLKTPVRGNPCPEQNKKYCLNGGECYLLPDNRSKYCICAEGFTGPRCQDRGDELETSKIDVRASNTDKALVFVGLFLTMLVLFVLVAILYCVAKMRYEFSSRKHQVVNEMTITSPFQPPYVNHKVQPMTTTFHMTEVEDAKSCNNTIARRPRLSAVSSAVEADPDFDGNFTKASRDETSRHTNNKRTTSSRHSTSSSNQGLLLVDDDVVDGGSGGGGGAPLKCNSHLAMPPHQPIHSALDACSSTATSSDADSSRPLSSRSKYENERLCVASRDRPNSPRCRTAEPATSNDLMKAPKSWSLDKRRQPDASDKSTEEVNNLLKELGVYLPEDNMD